MNAPDKAEINKGDTNDDEQLQKQTDGVRDIDISLDAAGLPALPTPETPPAEPAEPIEASLPAVDTLGSRQLLEAERQAANVSDLDGLGTYVAMFEQYRRDQASWLTPAQAPLVFHIAKLCQKLDADPEAPASLSSAYLQALGRLDRQRPGSPTPAPPSDGMGRQGSIFDELES